ncbi:MAG: tetratricopeptide repeat protein [Bacteroidetes bacterium]|nr:tetratricopeptide repeat protein [Bacteroidota bacterium]
MPCRFYIRIFFLAVVLLHEINIGFSHNNEIDSLKKIISLAKSDTVKATALNTLASELRKSNPDSAFICASQALELAQKANAEKIVADINNIIGLIKSDQSKYDEALEYYKKAESFFLTTANKKGLNTAYENIGVSYFSKGNYPKALEYAFKGLTIREELRDTANITSSYLNIGNVYYFQGSFDKALEYYLKGIALCEKTHRKDDITTGLLGNIGSIYYAKKEYDKTLDYYFKSLAINKEMAYPSGIATDYSNIGTVYFEQKKFPLAEENLINGLKLFEELGNKSFTAATLLSISDLYKEQGKFAQAEEALKKSQTLSEEAGDRENLKETYKKLSLLYDTTKQYKLAFDYHKLYSDIKDTLLNQDKSKEIGHLEAKSEYDKQQAIAEAEHNAETKRQKIITTAVSIGLFLVLVLAVFIFRSYRQKQKANVLLGEKNTLIEEQKKIVEEKNKDITDSINYAKRIQEAILPAKEIKYRIFPDAFVLFQPRDIVSGDFYWFAEKKGRNLIAAVDCTGHGVPGAFMSMIGNAFLNEIVNERGITQPGEILNQLRAMVIKSLKQSEDGSDSKDGMDIAICSFNFDFSEVEFAGANNPLWLIRNGGAEEFPGDKQPIGIHGAEAKPFTNHSVQLSKGDAVYIFTDGFADQFGGPKGKKFKYKQMQNLLVSLQDKKMLQQEDVLLKTINDWKGNYSQVDDVLVIGIRV